MATILIVDDDAAFREGLAETLTDLGHEAVEVASGENALARLGGGGCGGFDLVLLDLRMRGIDGLETLRRLHADHPECRELPVIVLTAHADSGNTIEAMKLGAFDHLTKPISREGVRGILERALGRPRLSHAKAAPMASGGNDQLIGSSPAMREVHKLIGLAAPSAATVLVQGETGTGKEEVARALHRHGPRGGKPFVAVNCAAIPAELLESELFGHMKGAFTGAVNQRVGRFSEANRGTLFLDEIGDMTLPMQAKILRVLQDRIVTPVGGASPVPVDVRIVAATHRDLIAMVRDGKFREDLFYRLNVVGRHPATPARTRVGHPRAGRTLLVSPRRRWPARQAPLAGGFPGPPPPILGPATCASCATPCKTPRSPCAARSSTAPTFPCPPPPPPVRPRRWMHCWPYRGTRRWRDWRKPSSPGPCARPTATAPRRPAAWTSTASSFMSSSRNTVWARAPRRVKTRFAIDASRQKEAAN